MICIDLFGDPIAWKRPGFKKAGKFLLSYDQQAKLKETCKWQIKSQYRNEPIACPVSLEIVFFMPIPKATSGIKKRQMLNGVCFHMKRPDLDNLQKFVLDCLTNVILLDDAQIVEIRAKKIYSDKPGTFIRIMPKTESGSVEVLHENTERLSR